MSEEEQRELHHFETERALIEIYHYVKQLEDWEAYDSVVEDILAMIPDDIKENE